MKHFDEGDRVQIEYGHSNSYELYQGTVKGRGYSAEQWRIQPDGSEKTEIVHSDYLTKLATPAKAA